MKRIRIRANLQGAGLILSIFITLAILMISSAVLELRRSRNDLYSLMESQSHTLLESITIGSQNSLRANEYLEALTRERLLNNAGLIRTLLARGEVTDDLLRSVARENRLDGISIFAPSGNRLYGSEARNQPADSIHFPVERLEPIFSGETDTLVVGILRNGNGTSSYHLALATGERGAVVLAMDAEAYLDFRRNTGFGRLINTVASQNEQIRYIALQDLDGILAATGNVEALESIESSEFLYRSFMDSLYLSRIIEFEGDRIFEVSHPFSYGGVEVGIIRIALSTQPLQDINQRIYRRLIISSVVLFLVGFLVFTYLFIRQQLRYVQKRYTVVESYSESILEHASDAILVFDRENGCRIFNKAAGKLFGVDPEQVLEQGIRAISVEKDLALLTGKEDGVRTMELHMQESLRYLLVSRSSFTDPDGLDYIILVLRDLTEQKRMEEEAERNQRLTAMGELASGVAHEIRNPLNAIGTIVQQLKKDFTPVEYGDEYRELTEIVYTEVRRINKTIEEFLRFARPEPIDPADMDPVRLVEELKTQYDPMLKEKNIRLQLETDETNPVHWDKNQIKQVLINLLQNAMEAMPDGGTITLDLQARGPDSIGIRVTDTGTGMDARTLSNIFNLYFTTKAQGTGIGLSLVQRIVYEHGGMIHAESQPDKGTTFRISLPRKAGKKSTIR
ncbi:MAG: ATP-binding protein [Bacteroidales bacterium]